LYSATKAVQNDVCLRAKVLTMALYVYHAFSRDGKKISGTVDASSSKSARDQLAKSGLFIVSINLVTEASKQKFSWNFFGGSVSVKDKIFFTKQLSVLLKAGVPLADALSLLSEQSEGKLKAVVVALRDGLNEGRSLADGLAAYPKIFEKIYVQLIRAGEASGRLELVLQRLTEYLERQQELQSKVSSALTGPLIQLGLIGGIVILLLVFVLPQISGVLEGQGQKLPAATRFLVGASDFLLNHYLFLIMICAGIYGAFAYWKTTPSGARTLDSLKLRTPIVKYFARTNAIVQFSRTLGMLLEGGVGLAESLDIVCNIVDNRILVDELKQARESIVKQGRVAEYLKKTGLFPPLAIYLINTGEQSGSLDVMLTQVAKQYEGELSELSDGLVARLNPFMMVVMAGVVGFIVMAIMGPVIGMSQNLSGMT